MQEGVPTILIECKWCKDSLEKHSSQLFRYFGTSPAKFAILTNGIIYKFYTDLDEANKMDLSPFLELDMLDFRDNYLNELKKFCKTNFDKDNIFSTASELKYSNLIKEVLKAELENPSDDFVRLLLSNTYEGQKTQKIIEKFKPVVKRSFSSFINEIISQKISSALSPEREDDVLEAESTPTKEEKVITTNEEIEAFYIVKGILGSMNIKDVVHRDTESYFGILYQDTIGNLSVGLIWIQKESKYYYLMKIKVLIDITLNQ